MTDELQSGGNQQDEQDFEEAISRLEQIVEELEAGGLSLEESLEKFSEGVKLVKLCNQKLNRAEKKIEMVLKEDEEYTEIIPFSQKEE